MHPKTLKIEGLRENQEKKKVRVRKEKGKIRDDGTGYSFLPFEDKEGCLDIAVQK